jgi:hypothetical protein
MFENLFKSRKDLGLDYEVLNDLLRPPSPPPQHKTRDPLNLLLKQPLVVECRSVITKDDYIARLKELKEQYGGDVVLLNHNEVAIDIEYFKSFNRNTIENK